MVLRLSPRLLSVTERTGHKMDSADQNSSSDPDFLFQAISSQGQLLGRHDSILQSIMQNQQSTAAQITRLESMLQNLTTPVRAQSSPPSASTVWPAPDQQPRESYVPDPEHYSGDMGKCGSFILQCSLVFSQKPLTYATGDSKIAFVMGLLKDKALAWASAVWQNDPSIRYNYDRFETELRRVFDHPVQGKEAGKRMMTLRQGSMSAAEYSVEFRTLAAEAGWDDIALMSVFASGLNEQLKDELAVKDDFEDLDSLITAAIKLDNRIRERRRDRTRQSSPRMFASPQARMFSNTPLPLMSVDSPNVSKGSEEPMQLGRTHLTPNERLRRIQAGECIYCGQRGHFLSTCPVRPKGGAHQ